MIELDISDFISRLSAKHNKLVIENLYYYEVVVLIEKLVGAQRIIESFLVEEDGDVWKMEITLERE